MTEKAEIKTFVFYDLPKVSLNDFYSGNHWSKRKKIKDAYKLLIKSRTQEIIDYPCDVEYEFWFKSRPLDCSNACGGMVKLIEDCLFANDSYNSVRSIKIAVLKRKEDVVFIKVREA